MAFQISGEKDEIPKMINGYIIKCGINKKEDFFLFFQNLGRENHLELSVIIYTV